MTPTSEALDAGFRQYNVSQKYQGGLLRYILQGIRPGSFLMACLWNDLKSAVSRADLMTGIDDLRSVMQFLMWSAPRSCWGDEDAVENWVRIKTREAEAARDQKERERQ